MSVWKWRFLCFGWTHCDEQSDDLIDMGGTTWRGWRRVWWRLYWSNPLRFPAKHHGRFWEDQAIQAFRQCGK